MIDPGRPFPGRRLLAFVTVAVAIHALAAPASLAARNLGLVALFALLVGSHGTAISKQNGGN